MTMTIKVLAAWVLTTGMATCASAAETPAGAPAARGFVHVVMPKNRHNAKLAIRSLADSREHLLVRSDEAPEGLGAWVPAGDYEIVEMGEFNRGVVPPIPVAAEHFTDLGGLMWVDIGDNEEVLLPFRHPEFARAAALSMARIGERVAAGTVAWTPKRPPRPRNIPSPSVRLHLGLLVQLIEDYRHHAYRPEAARPLRDAATIDEFVAGIRRIARPLSAPATDGSRATYYGADLGQVRVRDAEGRWAALDTGTVSPITAIGADGPRLIAGTGEGVLQLSDDGGRTWRKLAAVGQQEAVVDIDRAAARWLVLTSELFVPASGGGAVQRLRVHAAPDADPASLQLLRTVDVPPGQRVREPGAVRAEVIGDHYVFSAMGWMERLDLERMEWRRSDFPAPASFFSADARSGVIAIFQENGLRSRLFISRDGGESWTPLTRPGYGVESVHFATADSATATVWVSRGVSVAIEVLQFDAANERWTRVLETPAGLCVRSFGDVEHRQRFCATRGGDILRLEEKLSVEFSVN